MVETEIFTILLLHGRCLLFKNALIVFIVSGPKRALFFFVRSIS
jgi:hypothetical protein